MSRKVNSFVTLRSGPGSPGEQQAAAHDAFPSMLAMSHLRLWSPSLPIYPDRVLVGVATWSLYDLELLDRLQALLTRLDPQPVVDIFDVDDCAGLDDFDSYIPGIGRVYQTPVVGVWRDGVKTSSGWGAAGRKLLAENGLLD